MVKFLEYTLSEERVDYSKILDKLYENCHSVLNNHPPRKKKYIRGKNKPFMDKMYSRAIMPRIRFRNKFLKHSTEESKETSVFLFWERKKNILLKKKKKKKREREKYHWQEEILTNR